MKAQVIVVVVFLALLLATHNPAVRTDPDHAKSVLAKQGYTNVTITGWRFFSGSNDDWYATGFEATSPGGQRVSGVVTAGLVTKAATIRFD